MIDLRLVREDPEYVKAALRRRGMEPRTDELLEIDARRRDAQTRLDALRARQKQVGKEVPRLEGDAKQKLLDELKELSDEIKSLQGDEDSASVELTTLLLEIPNLPHESVPDGAGDENSVELRQWGLPPAFDFPVRDHLEIGQALDILDTERAAKVSGARFAYIKGKGALLELALVRFVVDKLGHHGFAPVITPVLVRREAMEGTGFLPTDEQQIYKLADDDLYLVGTSEVSIAAMHQDEFIDVEGLPLRYAGISTCFRREAGAYGKDTRGMVRIHQFDKVEMVRFTHPDQSWTHHEELTRCAETLLERLGLEYRRVALSTGDMSFASAKTFDLEAWSPGVERWLEVSSCSNFTDFQARRMNCRFRDADGKVKFVHTLNGSGLALPRIVISILENYQREDGSVEIPEVLHPYFGGDKELR